MPSVVYQIMSDTLCTDAFLSFDAIWFRHPCDHPIPLPHPLEHCDNTDWKVNHRQSMWKVVGGGGGALVSVVCVVHKVHVEESFTIFSKSFSYKQIDRSNIY